MTMIGYMVIKIGKRGITICLFNESEEDLKWICDACSFKGVKIVPCYKDEEGRKYIKMNDNVIKI